MIYGSNVCTSEKEESCKKQDATEAIHQWACSVCKKKKREQIHPYTYHLLWLRKLIKAGIRFSPDDLPCDTWEDLGMVNEMIDIKTRIF